MFTIIPRFWDTPNVVLYILTNEKYIGDTLCQKKYTVGFPFKKQVNHGERDQYYIEQTHECCPYVNTMNPLRKPVFSAILG